MTNVRGTQAVRRSARPIFVNTKHKCVKIIRRWDIAHIDRNASLHMDLKSYWRQSQPKNKVIELKNANHSGKMGYAGMVLVVSSSTMRRAKIKKGAFSKQSAKYLALAMSKAKVGLQISLRNIETDFFLLLTIYLLSSNSNKFYIPIFCSVSF
jgi:hypothetical protein